MNSLVSLSPNDSNGSNPVAQPHFESPLKKRPLHHLVAAQKEALVQKHLARPLKKKRLQEPLFSFEDKLDLDNVPKRLQPIVRAIEDYLPKLGHIVTAEARQLMRDILANEELALEDKEIELGLLFFYLTAHKPLPKELPLLDARLEEIEGEVLLLEEERKLACPGSKQIPSGAHHYIQRAFVHMIFTEDGSFNEGGCLAIKKMVSASRLSLLITEEERAQYLNTVTLLLEDEEFRDLFFSSINVHPTLKKVITLDLKKSSKETVSPLEIRWALLMQFFSLIGQTDEGNCYAVSIYLNLLIEHPKVLLKMSIEMLQTGKLLFEDVEIPVYLIVGNRLRWEKDFKRLFKQETAYSLTPMLVAQKALGIASFPEGNNTDAFALGDMIPHAFGKSHEEAKQLFIAHKFNMMQQTMLSILQFIAKNRSTPVQGLVPNKVLLFKALSLKYKPFLLDQLQEAGIDSQEEVQNLLTSLEREMYKKIYTVDVRNWDYKKQGERIVYENHAVGLKIKGKPPIGTDFNFISRIYLHNEGNFEPIERLSDFGQCLANLVDLTIDPTASPLTVQIASVLKALFISNEFQLIAADWLQEKNVKFKKILTSDDYLESDALFLNAEAGGTVYITAFGPLLASYAPRLSFTSTDIINFFENLCSHMRKIAEANPLYHTDSDHKVLMRYEGHSFNLTPHTFSEYWKSEEERLQERVYRPMHVLLEAPLSTEHKTRILMSFGGAEATTTYSPYLSLPMSAKEFKENLLAQIPAEEHPKFKEAFQAGLEEIPYQDFIQKAQGLVEKIAGRQLDQEESEQIARYFGKKNQFGSFLSPYQAAKLLKRALLTLEKSIFFSTYQLEQSIRKLYGIPEIIQIANLNWSGRQTEHLKYQTLILRINLADEELVFCIRNRGTDKPAPNAYKLILSTNLLPALPPIKSSDAQK